MNETESHVNTIRFTSASAYDYRVSWYNNVTGKSGIRKAAEGMDVYMMSTCKKYVGYFVNMSDAGGGPSKAFVLNTNAQDERVITLLAHEYEDRLRSKVLKLRGSRVAASVGFSFRVFKAQLTAMSKPKSRWSLEIKESLVLRDTVPSVERLIGIVNPQQRGLGAYTTKSIAI